MSAPPLTAELVEREYNARAMVPQHGDYFARWSRDSDYVRRTLPCMLDLRYGEDARQRIDLFPADKARGTLVFIHGGYWRSLDKAMFSWLASPWVAAGLNVALPNYRLCPSVRIEDIVSDALAAVRWLFEDGPRHGFAMERVIVSGHSAGGHLAASIFAAPRAMMNFDPGAIAGGVALSGIFDFAPLVRFSGNADFGLDAPAAARLDLYTRRPTVTAPFLAAVGGAESSEFKRQASLIAERWAPQAMPPMVVPGAHHFSIVDALGERGQPLYESTLALLD